MLACLPARPWFRTKLRGDAGLEGLPFRKPSSTLKPWLSCSPITVSSRNRTVSNSKFKKSGGVSCLREPMNIQQLKNFITLFEVGVRSPVRGGASGRLKFVTPTKNGSRPPRLIISLQNEPRKQCNAYEISRSSGWGGSSSREQQFPIEKTALLAVPAYQSADVGADRGNPKGGPMSAPTGAALFSLFTARRPMQTLNCELP
jgi:hypothetical protein